MYIAMVAMVAIFRRVLFSTGKRALESIELRCFDSRKEHAMPGPASISMAITGLGCGVTLRFCRAGWIADGEGRGVDFTSRHS